MRMISFRGSWNGSPISIGSEVYDDSLKLPARYKRKAKVQPSKPIYMVSPSGNTSCKSVSANHEAKLSIKDVHSIRAMADAGRPIKEIAARHKISKRQVNRIKARISFAWLPEKRGVKS